MSVSFDRLQAVALCISKFKEMDDIEGNAFCCVSNWINLERNTAEAVQIIKLTSNANVVSYGAVIKWLAREREREILVVKTNGIPIYPIVTSERH